MKKSALLWRMTILFVAALLCRVSPLWAQEESGRLDLPLLPAEQVTEISKKISAGEEVSPAETLEELGDLSQRLAWESDKSKINAYNSELLLTFENKERAGDTFMAAIGLSSSMLTLRTNRPQSDYLAGGIRLALGDPKRQVVFYPGKDGTGLLAILPPNSAENFSLLLCPRSGFDAGAGKNANTAKSGAPSSFSLSNASASVGASIVGLSPFGFGISEMRAIVKTTKNITRSERVLDFDRGKDASVRIKYTPSADPAHAAGVDTNGAGVVAEYFTKNPAGYVRHETKRDVVRISPGVLEAELKAENTGATNLFKAGECYLLKHEAVRTIEYKKEDPISTQ